VDIQNPNDDIQWFPTFPKIEKYNETNGFQLSEPVHVQNTQRNKCFLSGPGEKLS
jgi:hypothetical protein